MCWLPARTESVRTFATLAFKAIGVTLEWRGEGLDEIAVDIDSGKTMISINDRFYRPAEVNLLIGDATKPRQIWAGKPTPP